MVLLQTPQLVDVHIDLVLLAGLLELLLVDVVALDGVGLEQNDVILVSSFEVSRHKNLFHHQIINAGFAILINVIYLVEAMIAI